MAAAHNRGFTLLEVLVAVAVLATALVSLLSLHGQNVRTIAYDRRLSRATLLAQDLMTRTLVAEAFPDLTRSSGDFASDPDYHWELEVLRGPTRDLEDQVREIRIRVFWDERDPDAVRLATLVRRPEP
ncbi:MAG: prepilin-type N-terminal cleavage/methylation domain-containing protein [Candidatus Binatia bacterium]